MDPVSPVVVAHLVTVTSHLAEAIDRFEAGDDDVALKEIQRAVVVMREAHEGLAAAKRG